MKNQKAAQRAEWNQRLVDLARAGDKTARDKLVLDNMGLVLRVVDRQTNGSIPSGIEKDDLIQAGSMGILDALKDHNADKGSFSTHATWHIFKHVMTVLSNRGVIKITRDAGLRKRYADQIERANKTQHIDAPMRHGEDKTSARLVADPRSTQDRDAVDDMDAIGQQFGRVSRVMKMILSAREHEIVTRRFGLNGRPEKLREIAETMGCTHERVRQIERRAMLKLRSVLRHNEAVPKERRSRVRRATAQPHQAAPA